MKHLVTSETESDGCYANIRLSFSILGSLGSQAGNGDTIVGGITHYNYCNPYKPQGHTQKPIFQSF